MSAKFYCGFRDEHGTASVYADGEPLAPRLDLDNHSPTGFEWGYGGSGPAQLALALLADALGNDAIALRLHQAFKWAIVARLKRGGDWMMSGDAIRTKAAELNKENGEKGKLA